MRQSSLAVSYSNDKLRDKAMQLAKQLQLPLGNSSAATRPAASLTELEGKSNEPRVFLQVSEERLSLKLAGFSPLSADFSFSFWQKRQLEGKNQALIRACKPKAGIRIIDATAGWGQDAALLACFGAEVLMLERHPVMAVLLDDALQRQDENSREKMRLSLLAVDARDYLSVLKESDFPDVIYLDPMHPPRQKSALVKKDMQALQQLVGKDADALELLQLARTRVKQRVVVKWPQKQASIAPADASIEGKTVRFDMYFPL